MAHVNFKMKNYDFEKLEKLGKGNPDEGFKRLMLLVPKSSTVSLGVQINEVEIFVDKFIVKVDMTTGELLSNIWKAYLEYCYEKGTRPLPKMKLVRIFENLGFMYGQAGGNTRKIFGARCDWI